ncbi:hypothetical protein CP556_24455 [Natrinema sp. CBA1119]|nr:hypothetical protein CP556_24455 [Natrinema sp. CBA1119]
MGGWERLKRAVSADGEPRRSTETDSADVIYECRHCGTTVDQRTEYCPACGVSEIATYAIE